MQPPSNLTAEEFGEQYSGSRVELIDGVVEELPMSDVRTGKIVLNLAFEIGIYLEANDIGTLSGFDSFIQVGTNPLRVRGADVCFYSYERLPKGPIPSGLLPNIPDLIAEVISPGDPRENVLRKVGEYLGAGVRVVIVLDSETSSATLFRPNELPQKIGDGDDLVVEDVLPGFRTKLGLLFD